MLPVTALDASATAWLAAVPPATGWLLALSLLIAERRHTAMSSRWNSP